MGDKHTPGPWVVGPTDDTVVTHLGADGLRYEIAAIDGDYNQPETWPVMEANARLIAAAPELLRELRDTEDRYAKALREAGYSDLFVTQATASIRAALSKATTPTASLGLSTSQEPA